MSERKRAREVNEAEVRDLLRGRILSGIHGGHLNGGDRAQTYRESAAETSREVRVIAAWWYAARAHPAWERHAHR